jgi:hypothetical protein
MLGLPALLLALLLAAPGDLYRCTGADGRVGFQDRPCAAGAGSRLSARGGDPAAAERELRAWLRSLQAPAPPRAGTSAPSHHMAAGSVVLDEATLATCSARFLACADQRQGRMDDCIARTPSCSGAPSGACCPAAVVARYRSLRQGGADLPGATRAALLGE